MKRLLILGSALILAACSNNTEPLGADFGNAVQQNRTAHIINPAPAYDGPATTDGERTAHSFGRYVRGEVKLPVRVGTTEAGKAK